MILLGTIALEGCDAHGSDPITKTVTRTVTVGTVADGPTEGEDGGTSTSPSTETQSPPRILSVSANVAEITQGESVRITAIVTDPDGIDDVIGGELGDPTGASYGAFATGAQEGAYEIQVSWDDLDAVDPITFDDGYLARTLLVRFYDVAGSSVEEAVEISLVCRQGAACDGVCRSLDDDPQNCGQCGRRCEDQDAPDAHIDATCSAGSCLVATSCVSSGTPTCNDVCADAGMTCGPTFEYTTPFFYETHDVVGLGFNLVNGCDQERIAAELYLRCTDTILFDEPNDQALSAWCVCGD